jgi:hypothetical protein
MEDTPFLPGRLKVTNYNPKEEATLIESLTMLRFSYWKAFMMPLWSLLTLMILPVRLYWSAELRAYYLYS